MRWCFPLLILIIAVINSGTLIAQGGTLRGVVRSIEDGEPLLGVSVSIHGILLGNTTNVQGEFTITRVPAGVYTLDISMVGFAPTSVMNVRISEDSVASIKILLTPRPVQTQTMVVTASKHEQNIQEIPASVAVMGAEMIRTRNIITMDEALRYVPGVNMTQWQINIRGSSGYARGIGSRVLVLLDGIPYLTGDTGEIIFESIPVMNIDRVEVVKGAGSALYGSNALGGVINIITKDAGSHPLTVVKTFVSLYDRPFYDQWSWSAKTRGQAGLYLTHTQRFDRLTVAVSANRTVDDGYRENDYARRLDFYAKAGYEFSPFTRWTLSTNIYTHQTGSFLYWRDISHALQPPLDQLGQWVKTTRANVSSDFKTFLTEDISFTFRSMWYRTNWEDNVGDVNGAGDKSVANLFVNEAQIGTQIDSRQYLTAGIEGRIDRVDANIFGKRSGAGGAFYVQDEYTVSQSCRLTGGARYDYQKIDSLSAYSRFNPKVGVTVSLSEGLVVRASVGSGFRVPTMGEAFTVTNAGGLSIIPNPSLKPERSWSMEVGSNARWGSGLSIDFALFRNEFWDMIEPRFVVINGKSFGQFNNVTRARIVGGEVSIQSSLIRDILKSEIAYTYVYPRDLTLNDLLKYRPRHVLMAGLEGTVGSFSAGIDFRFISRIDRIDQEFVSLNIVKDGDLRVPIYVTDARLMFDAREYGIPARLTLNAYNIFQYYYIELIGNIAPVRRFTLTVETAF